MSERAGGQAVTEAAKKRGPMQNIRPWLWLGNKIEEAARFYASVFKNSSVTNVSYYGENGPGKPGEPMVVNFVLDGVDFMALNGGSEGEYSSAFYVDCDTQEYVDLLWERLSEGGEPGVCGWLKDRYGVSWNIVPSRFGELMQDDDDEKTGRMFQAMLGMKKLDIRALEAAFNGE
jgi:predicted 3-demethylubiquinone-9 3-methyltransferase (glyoxalase superfamily)